MDDSRETRFTIGDPVRVHGEAAAAVGLDQRDGQVIGFDHSGPTWVIVRFDGQPSGRPDFGWLFTDNHLTTANSAMEGTH